MNKLAKTFTALLFITILVSGGLLANEYMYSGSSATKRISSIFAGILGSIVGSLGISLFRFIRSEFNGAEKSKNSHKLLFYIAAFLIPAKDRDIEIGNMIERFNKDKKRFGQKRAIRLLAFDVITSAYPLIRRSAGLVVRTILRAIGLYKIYKMFWG